MPAKKKKLKKKPKAKTLHHRVSKLEDIDDELRIIGSEYSDIKNRLENTDLLIDHIIRQMHTERIMRRISMLLIVIVLLLVVITMHSLSTGF